MIVQADQWGTHGLSVLGLAPEPEGEAGGSFSNDAFNAMSIQSQQISGMEGQVMNIFCEAPAERFLAWVAVLPSSFFVGA